MSLMLADAVLAIGVLELLVLLALRRTVLVPTLLSGLALMVALRLALAGHGPSSLALALLASGLVHAIDLRRRWSAAGGARALLSAHPTKEKP